MPGRSGDEQGRTPGRPGERPKVRVTDKRRVRPEDELASGGRNADAQAEAPPAEAPPAEAPPAEAAESELERAKREAAEYLDHLQRLKAEFENYRKRVLKEQTRAVEFAAEPLILRLLEVIDEFELALVAAEQKPDFDKFLQGVEMVYAKLVDILRAEGLERIEAKGKPFDPALHEALFHGEEEDEGEPHVADVLRTGYRLKGRVVRPAGVKVERR